MNDKAKIDALRAALEGVIRVADRATVEFDAARAALALTADASEQAPDRRRCKPCAATRGGDNCWKCGTATFEPHPSCGDDPALPPIDRIRELAKEVGYAIGVHGSQQRDFDVIAAPWTDAAIGNYALLEHIAKGLTTDNGPAHIISTERKPLGRYAATIQMDGWYKQLDISVCPNEQYAVLAATPAAPVADTGAVAWAVTAQKGGIHKLSINRESAERKAERWRQEWPNNGCRVRPLVFGDTPASPAPTADSAADARKGCRDAFNLISNCRKLMSERQMDKAANWVIACELFAVGSTTAMAICREADIDPMAYKIQKLAAMQTTTGSGE